MKGLEPNTNCIKFVSPWSLSNKIKTFLVHIKFFAKIITEPLLVYRYFYEQFRNFSFFAIKKVIRGGRGRTCNRQIRSLKPYPLGHTPLLERESGMLYL